MICPKCGHETSGNYCNYCGTPLETGYSMESDEEYEVRRRLSEELAEIEDQPSYDVSYNPISRLKDQIRPAPADTKADGSGGYQPQGREAERQKTKEKTAKFKKSKGSSDGRKAAAKSDRKEQQKREARMKKLEGEVERLRSSRENSSRENSRREDSSRENSSRKNSRLMNSARVKVQPELPWKKRWTGRAEQENGEFRLNGENGMPDPEPRVIEKTESAGVRLGDVMVKSVVTAAVIISRVMQLASFLLMAGMVFLMARSFWEHGQALGDIRFIAAESNYGMALYVGFAGITLFTGLIWCLWILSKKGAGGGVRMKKYDTGRGFLPFLLCMAAVVSAAAILPQIPAGAEVWRGMANGAAAAMEAVNAHRDTLFICSAAGTALSLVRKLLRV